MDEATHWSVFSLITLHWSWENLSWRLVETFRSRWQERRGREASKPRFGIAPVCLFRFRLLSEKCRDDVSVRCPSAPCCLGADMLLSAGIGFRRSSGILNGVNCATPANPAALIKDAEALIFFFLQPFKPVNYEDRTCAWCSFTVPWDEPEHLFTPLRTLNSLIFNTINSISMSTETRLWGHLLYSLSTHTTYNSSTFKCNHCLRVVPSIYLYIILQD